VKVRDCSPSGPRRELGILRGAALSLVLALAVAAWGREGIAQASAVEPTLRYTVDSVHREIIVELSPLNLPAHASHHDIPQLPPQALVVPVTGWIEGYAGEIVDSAGGPIPRVVIHHLNLIVPQRRELFSTIMQRMGAAGAETPPVLLPAVFGHPVLGYPISRGDTLLVTIMLNNPTATAYHDARLRIRLPYAARNSWPRPMSIYPFYLDVMPPAGSHDYDLPAGHSEKSWEGRPAVPGRILAIGGHLHEYGVALRVEDVTAGRLLWGTTPVTDAAGQIVAIPNKTFWWRLGVPLYPDHTYRVTAVYDNPTGRTIRDGAMGAVAGVFLPADMDRWPAVDRTSPEYQRDVQVTYDTRMGDMDDMQNMDGAPTAPKVAAGATGTTHEGVRNASYPTRRSAQTP
jgi:hypothetical protein